MGCFFFFFGFQSKKVPLAKNSHFLLLLFLLITVGAGTRKGSPDIRDDGKNGSKGSKSVCGVELGGARGVFVSFSFTLVMEH